MEHNDFTKGILLTHVVNKGTKAHNALKGADTVESSLDSVCELSFARGALWGLWAADLINDDEYLKAMGGLYDD